MMSQDLKWTISTTSMIPSSIQIRTIVPDPEQDL